MKIGAVMFFTSNSMQPAELGRELESRKIKSLWVPEHTHIPLTRKTQYPAGGPLIRPYYDIYDPFMALNTAAAVTTNLRIGTGVCLVPQRDPIVTAKMVSSLDRISQGRFLFGVGNGWNQDEIENHGTDFKTRHKLGRERIEAMKAIWTQEAPEYHGELVNIEKMNQWPKPVQQPHPPIIVGGAYPYAARRAVAYGNGWIPRADRLAHDGIGVVIGKFRDMAGAAGRDPSELPITIFRVPDDLTQLRFCEEIGIDRIVFSLPADKADAIMPILDRWSTLKQQLEGWAVPLMPDIPTLTTSQLILRPLELADADVVQVLFPHWEIVRFLGHVPWPYPADGALCFIRDKVLPSLRQGTEWHWSIRQKTAPEQLIGEICLRDKPNDNRGFWLAQSAQGQGLMAEAAAAVTNYWFETLQRPTLRVLKAVANVRSRRVSERAGMRLVETLERDFVSGRLPAEVFEITREEWLARSHP